MDQNDRDLLLEMVRVLDVVTDWCPPEMRRAFHPLIFSAEFIGGALGRNEQRPSYPRLVARHWLLLGEFFESVLSVGRAEFFVEEARKVVAAHGLLETCRRLALEAAARSVPGRKPTGSPSGV